MGEQAGHRIIGELHELCRYAAGLRDSIARARAGGPRFTEAADRSGTVRIVLDAEGLPEAVRVGADWRRCLAPTAFGDAVMEAFHVAAGERMAAWSRTVDDAGPRSPTVPLPTAPLPTAPLPTVPSPTAGPAATVATRPLGALAEDVMRAFDGVREIAATMPLAATGTGSGGSGRLVVTLSRAGLVSCTAEARWAGRQSGPALTTVLNQALAAARADLARALAVDSPTAGLDRLVAEALTILADPLRFTRS